MTTLTKAIVTVMISALTGSALSLPGCDRDEPARTQPAPTAQPSRPAAATEAPAPTQITWLASLDEGLARAGAENKLVLVDFYADWCGWCHELDKRTWPDAKVVAAVSASAIAVKIDADANAALRDKYGVRGLPTLVFLNADSSKVHEIVGFIEPAEFLEELKTAQRKAR